MNKVFVVGILAFMICMVFVSGYVYEIRFFAEKGWNLVYGLGDSDQLKSGLVSSDIKAIYLLVPKIQEYIRIYPNPETNKISQLDKVKEFNQGVFWVYSDSRVETQYGVDNMPFWKDKQMYRGWNFISLTPENIQESSPNEIRGNCNIEKTYSWDAHSAFWDDETDQVKGWVDTNKFTSGDVALAQVNSFLVKVSSDCTLGSGISNVNPPALP